MSATTKKTYQGKALNELTIEIVKAAEILLKYDKGTLTIVQGGYNRGGVAASAGTHDGGGALDLTASDWKKKEEIFRKLGCAAWYRPTLKGHWSAHVHLIVDGDPTASAGAKRQVVSYHNRRNGLANNATDQGYRMAVFPKFVFGAVKQRWEAVRDTQGYWQPTASKTWARKGTSRKKGYVWDTPNIATVRVGSVDWIVTESGTFYKKSDFKKFVKIDKTEDKTVYEVTANPFLWGLAAPGVGNERTDQAAKGTQISGAYSTELSNGEIWVESTKGNWYSKKYLKAVSNTTDQK